MATKFNGKPRAGRAGKSKTKRSSKGTAKQRKARAANFKSGSLNAGGMTWSDIPD